MSLSSFTFIAALLSLSFAASPFFSGSIFQNGYAHIVNITGAEAQDSNQVTVAITGNPLRGQIVLTERGPSTFCPFGPTSCGRNVHDITVTITVRNRRLTLQSMVNNPNPNVTGVASDYLVVGTWIGDALRWTASYSIRLSLPGGIWSVVPIKVVYAGTVNLRNVFTGFNFGWVIPYVSLQQGGINPYEFLITYGPILSSQPYSTIAGYRVYSPIAVAPSTTFPPSPNAVSGTVNNVVFDGGLIHGKINLSTPVGSHINVTNAAFTSDYEILDLEIGYIRINGGLVTDLAGNNYFLENLNLLIEA
jgi:hypothetical protein